MPITYINTDVVRRVWPDIQLPDETTLELASGESVELEQEIEDHYLKPVPPKTAQKKQAKEEKKAEEEAEKADAEAQKKADEEAAATTDDKEQQS